MTNQTAVEFIKQADIEIQRGDFHGAWKIAVEGLKSFPEHAELQKYEYILAPPKVTMVPRDPNQDDGQADIDWIKENRKQYRGCWVALKNGQLLASGKDLDEIVEQIGEIKNTGILVTVIY
ncbi:MAG: hypothetical protein GDA44_04395 [Prochloron sp. SP5CPC1]|nr:hypothetical protein [Candidatus Paraprochloron terpiosi SP5CPC1]